MEPFHRLGHKLHHTSKALKTWANSLLSEARQKLHMAQEIILCLDEAQDFRPLSDAEHSLRSKLKKRICNTLKFSNSKMLIGKITKQRFSYNFKILPKIYLLYEKFSIGKSIDCFSKLN
jgi:hypothetical protein